jgi:eukaryotic-like serine/threonine-protein kinase
VFTGTARFQLLDKLGAGSMCIVHRALDRMHGDVVALKTLRHLDSNSLYRLKQEFRSLSTFDHPNLVSFYELVASDVTWFVTMELVDGVDFLTWCRGHVNPLSSDLGLAHPTSAEDLRFSHSAPAGMAASKDHAVTPSFRPHADGLLPDVIRLRSGMRQLAEGVATLHEAGRIHRDLKPSNVLVTDAGRVVILDFGLIADVDQDYTEGTLHQNIAGSAAYMSPEQSVGKPLTPAADWYSIGVMLYEALTGVWPYQGHLYHILTTKQKYDPPAPNTLLSGVPEDLNDLCMGLLDRQPARRPTVTEILGTLHSRRPVLGVARTTETSFARYRFRDEQLTQLDQAFKTARWGKGVVCLVRGAPGTGKTSVVREFVKRIKQREQIHALKGRCYQWETVPYKALDGVMDNLTRVLRRLDHREVEQYSVDELSCLAHLFPVLRRVDALRLDSPADPSPANPRRIRRHAFRGFFHLIRSLAESSPVILTIDDVQWGDVDSAGVLADLFQAIKNDRVMVILGFTPQEVPRPFFQAIMPVLKSGRVDVRTIDLEPLSFEQSSGLAAQLMSLPVDAPAVRDVALASGGLPHTVKEVSAQTLLRRRGGELPGMRELSEVVVAEINALPAAPRRLLELVTVAGPRPVTTEVVVAAAKLEGASVDALSTLQALQLVHADARTGTLETIGSTIRDFVIDQLDDEVHRQHHRDLATAIEVGPHNGPEALVKHYVGAGNTEKAGLLAWLSAKQALDSGSNSDAAWLLDHAVELGSWSAAERRSMLTLLAKARARIGQGKRSADAFAEAASDAPDAKRLWLLHQAVEQLLYSGHQVEGVELLNRVMKQLKLPPTPSVRCAAPQQTWLQARLWWRGDEFSERLDVLVDPDELLRVDVSFTAAAGLGLVNHKLGATLLALHYRLALDAGEPTRVLRAIATRVPYLAQQAGDEWERVHARAVDIARPLRSYEVDARLTMAAGIASYMNGQYTAAVDPLLDAERTFRTKKVGFPWEQHLALFYAQRAHIGRGDLRSAAQLLFPMQRRLRSAHNPLFDAYTHAGVAVYLRLAEDEPDKATQELTNAMEHWQQAPICKPHAYAVGARAAVALYQDRPQAAWDIMQDQGSVFRRASGSMGRQLTTELWLWRARAALALAASGAEPRRLGREARAALWRARRNPAVWVDVSCRWLEIGLARLEGETSLASLQELVLELDRAEMWLLGA